MIKSVLDFARNLQNLQNLIVSYLQPKLMMRNNYKHKDNMERTILDHKENTMFILL